MIEEWIEFWSNDGLGKLMISGLLMSGHESDLTGRQAWTPSRRVVGTWERGKFVGTREVQLEVERLTPGRLHISKVGSASFCMFCI